MAAFAPPSTPAVSAAANRATSPRTRTNSITQLFDANPHSGICAATGDALSSVPSLKELRRNSLGSVNSGRTRSGAGRRRGSSGVSPGSPRAQGPIREEGRVGGVESLVVAVEKEEEEKRGRSLDVGGEGEGGRGSGSGSGEDEEDDGEKPHWWAVTKSGLAAFWKWFLTPMGFLLTIYMLNIVAWGGMLFLLLINAAPAMCKPTCNDLNSPRRIWIEIDSQILNALFCVTGFGLIPWRFRDLWFLLRWRLQGRREALGRLEEIHSGWFRGPVDNEEEEQGMLVGRAPTTKSWKMDAVVWLYVWNTFFQVVLSGFMWGMNRVQRPSWSTGLFVALACIVAGAAGGIVWWEGKRVKRVEGEGGEKKREVQQGCGSVEGVPAF